MKRYPMYMDEQQNTSFESRLTAALERREEVAIPADFAARIAAQLPVLQPVRRRIHAGRTIGILAAIVCVLALAWLAPHTAPSFTSVAFDVELLLFVQLACIAAWFTTRREV